MHYDSSLKKIIVRDMARVARGKMSDRREDLTTAQVKCYIYNSKTTTPTTPTILTTPTTPTIPTVNTGTLPMVNTGTTISPTIPTTPTTPIPVTPTRPTTPNTPIIIPQKLDNIPQTPINKKLSLTLTDISDLAQHFLSQYDLNITLTGQSRLKLGEVNTLILEITDKKT